MKVLLMGRFSRSEVLSGPEKFAKRIFEQGCKSDLEIVFLDYFRGRTHQYTKKIFGFETSNKNDCQVIRIGLLSCLVYLIRERPQIIHIVTFELFTILTFFYKLFSRVKVIYTVHGIVRYENRFNKKKYNRYYLIKDDAVEKLLFRFSDKIVFVSQKLKSFAAGFYNLQIDNRFKIIPNGFDSDFLKSFKKIPNLNEPLRLLLVGELDRPEKGYQTFFTALKSIKFPVEVSVISDVVFSDVENDFGNARIRIYKKMPTSEYYDFLTKHDIYLSNSSYEPFQIVLVEAMAVGLLPIVTRETGASYLIQDGINGFLYNSGDFIKLANLLNYLNKERNKIVSISLNIRNDLAGFSWDSIFRKYEKIYHSLFK